MTNQKSNVYYKIQMYESERGGPHQFFYHDEEFDTHEQALKVFGELWDKSDGEFGGMFSVPDYYIIPYEIKDFVR